MTVTAHVAVATAPRRHRERLALVVTGSVLVAVIALFMTYDLKGSLDFALELRGKKVASMILVGTGLAVGSVVFHTISANRILTPSLIGLDALYVLIQSLAAYTLGTLQFLSIDVRIRFSIAVAIMMTFALALNAAFIRRAAGDLPLLILGGIVLGGMFTSLSALVARLLEPNEFTTLQDQLFASFATVNEQLLGFSALVVVVAIFVIVRMRRLLDAVALGRPMAISIGVDFDRVTRISMGLVALLVAVPTALVGPVTFLGLLAANIAYQMARTFRHHITIPLAAMAASVLLIGAQFLLEQVLEFRTRASIIVGFVGGLAFLVLLIREMRR